MLIEKSLANADSEVLLLDGSGSLGAKTETAPPLKFPPVVGVTTTVILSVAPDCSEGMAQVNVVVVAPPELHVPGLAFMETGVTFASPIKFAVTVMLLARSGPLLVMV